MSNKTEVFAEFKERKLLCPVNRKLQKCLLANSRVEMLYILDNEHIDPTLDGYFAFDLHERHIIFNFLNREQTCSVFITEGIMLDKIAKGENF